MKIDITSRYISNEEIRQDMRPYEDYYKCLQHTFNSIDSFCDIGCATGHLIYYVKKNNPTCRIQGYEYFAYHKESSFCQELIKNNITILDIRDPILSSEKYTIVNCTEVGEHIDAIYADQLIENAKKLSSKYIIFTWSSHGNHKTPGCDSHHQHLNPLEFNEYVALIKKHGLKENMELTNKFLNASREYPNFYFWWRESFIIWEI